MRHAKHNRGSVPTLREIADKLSDQDRRFYESINALLDKMGAPRRPDQEQETTTKIIPLWRK